MTIPATATGKVSVGVKIRRENAARRLTKLKDVEKICAFCAHYTFKNLNPFCLKFDKPFPHPQGGKISKNGESVDIQPAGVRTCQFWKR